ncbi:hypothetical protein [Mammaliicoccus lentus]|uniref:hypothetical protein n=1 Tax=Mammaliicoccus lentus TaxID=42858 RepID=UPI00374EF3AF
MKYLIILTISLIALYVFVKRTYKISSVQDSIDAPIDYESDQYKEAEAFFIGLGRC